MNGITGACFGRLGRDPEQRFLASGQALATFSIAIDDPNAKEDAETEWLSVTVWNELAEDVAAHFKKGQLVYVEGRVRMDYWETKDEGHYKLSMRAWSAQAIAAFARKRESETDPTSRFSKIADTQGRKRKSR